MTDGYESEYERLLAENERYADQLDRSELKPTPLAGLAILTCMDARIVVEDVFGLRPGDANIIRNAGAVASTDAIRSLVLSQRLLGTREVVVLGHSGCGLHQLAEDALRAELVRATGQTDDVGFGSFGDLDEHVRTQVQRIREHPWILPVPVHGLVYEVATGRVREVA